MRNYLLLGLLLLTACGSDNPIHRETIIEKEQSPAQVTGSDANGLRTITVESSGQEFKVVVQHIVRLRPISEPGFNCEISTVDGWLIKVANTTEEVLDLIANL